MTSHAKIATVIIVSAVCGALAFAIFPSTAYAIAAALLSWFASVATIWFVEDQRWIKR